MLENILKNIFENIFEDIEVNPCTILIAIGWLIAVLAAAVAVGYVLHWLEPSYGNFFPGLHKFIITTWPQYAP